MNTAAVEEMKVPARTHLLGLMEERSSRVLIWGILLGAAALRTAFATAPHVCFGDESCYLMLAENLFAGEGYNYYNHQPELHFPPLFPIALGVLNWLVRDIDAVSRVAYVIFGTLLIVPAYLFAKDVYGRTTGLLAAFVLALLPAFTSGVLFAETLSEPLYLFLLFSGVYLAHLAATRQGMASYAGAGAALCLAYLTRPEGMVHFTALGGYLLLVLAARRPLPLRAAAARLLVYGAAFLAVAAPYVVYLHHHTGEWALTTKDSKTYTTTRGLVHRQIGGPGQAPQDDLKGGRFQKDTWGLDGSGEVKYFSREPQDGIVVLLLTTYRDRVIPDVKWNIGRMRSTIMKPWVFGKHLFWLVLLGILGAAWRRERLWAEGINFLTILPVCGFTVFFIKERFLYAAIVPLVFWTAVGMEHILLWIERTEFPSVFGSPRFRAALQVLFIAAVAAYLATNARTHFMMQREEQAEVWSTAAWLEKNTPAGAIVLSTGPEVAFHAKRDWLPVPYASRSEVVKYGRERGGSYLCMRRRYLERRPEQRRELFDNAGSSEDLELLQKTDSFIVYRIRQPGDEDHGAGGDGER